MVKVFKNYTLSVFIVLAFSFSQVVNVSANSLNNNSQKEEVSVFRIGSKKEKEIDIVAPSLSHFTDGTKNEAAIEGKLEKVLESITIGNFGIGVIIGYASCTLGMLLGWIISKIIMTIKSSFGN
ncbi:hypothetical protein [Bartonella rattaustraliani]|uniref:hypothetical protein n=1 Tax=Bartonella rattaustraliani TaxID=481139 RepID=UPI0002DD5331|nr:hypothetical protein [Bartonella rattaustraliani]